MQVGAQVAENLFYQVVAVLAHYDSAGSLLLFHLWNVADYGGIGDASHVVASFDAEAERPQQPDAAGGYEQSQHERYQVGVAGIGRDTSGRPGFFDDASVVGFCGQGDCVLLAFLEQHQVEVRLYFLLTAYVAQLAFLLRGIADACAVFPGFHIEVVAGDLQGFLHALDCGAYGVARGGNRRVEVDYCRTVGFRCAQQPVALYNHTVVLGDDVGQCLVGESDVCRNHVILVGRVLDIFPQVGYQAQLVVVVGTFAVVFGVALQGKLSVGVEVGETGAPLVRGQLVFGCAQFLVDDAYALVDEFGCPHRNLVLVLVCLFVIDVH